jgi:hypothetical protein
MLRRFFRSAEHLIGGMTLEDGGGRTWSQRWTVEFYRHELRTLPGKIGAWGKAINHKDFPNIVPAEVQALVTSLQTLVYRIEELLEAGDAPAAEPLVRALGEDLQAWRSGVEATFGRWSVRGEAEPAAALRERLTTWRAGLEKRIGEALQQTGAETVSGRDAESFFRLLGGVRGVSEAAVAYAAVAGTIDLPHWREEVFSLTSRVNSPSVGCTRHRCSSPHSWAPPWPSSWPGSSTGTACRGTSSTHLWCSSRWPSSSRLSSAP